MLFVSRVVDGLKFGIVDTDDGTETLVYRDELNDAVLIHHVDIKGVKIGYNRGLHHNTPFIKEIMAQQDMRQYTNLQAKTKTLLGVEVRVYAGEITAILADTRVAKDGVRIRLSDFGATMSWESPVRWVNGDTKNRLILVLDDKIKMVGREAYIRKRGVCLDISDITNNDVVSSIVHTLYDQHHKWSENLIDSNRRTRFGGLK